MSKPDEITCFTKHNNSAYGIRIVSRCFGRYYMTIRKVSDNSAVVYNSANKVDVMQALRAYDALNDPAVSLMFPQRQLKTK